MSAIAGILFFHGAPLEPGLIEKLTSVMSARGPDSQAQWVNGSVGLGHCMLRTTPESLLERQPLMSQEEKLILVWDGRLDNRVELRRALTSHGAVLRDNSDAEMVLQCYAVWGEECPKRLLGDFAFAVWDDRRKKLFCARDHVGARPFYYTYNDRFFAFASEDDALLSLPGVSSQPNEEWIATMFVPAFEQCIDPCQAWISGARMLGAGQQATLTMDGQMDLVDYWKLEPQEDVIYDSTEDYEEAFFEVFNDAVRCRMRTVDDPGVMMSGGLDSAGIAAMIKNLLPNIQTSELQTYSAISDEPDSCMESRCIKSLTRDYGDRANFASLPSMNGMIGLQDLIDFAWSKSSVHPVDNSVLLPAMMCLSASRNGQRVLLHGVSGDLANHSPTRYQSYLLRDGLFRMAWRECVDASVNNTYLRGERPSLLMLQNMKTVYAPQAAKAVYFRLRRSLKSDMYSNGLIDRDFYETLRIEERIADQASLASSEGLPGYQAAHIRALLPLGLRIGLEAYERVAGRCGVELRDPWADRRVLEFLVNLPLDHKVRHGWTKYMVRTKIVSELGAEIRWRKDKKHLGWHLHMRLAAASERFFTGLVADKQSSIYEYVDRNAVLFHIKRFKATRNPESADYCVWLETLSHWIGRLTFL